MKQRNPKLVSGSTMVARGVVYLAGFAALAVLFILLPELAREEAVGKANPPVVLPFFIIAYILATPFFVALYQTLRLLHFVDKNKFFSEQAIKKLRNIKRCAITFSMLVVIAAIGGLSFSKIADPTENVTFIVTLGLLLMFIASIMAVFVAVLEKLLSDAVALKSENDLII